MAKGISLTKKEYTALAKAAGKGGVTRSKRRKRSKMTFNKRMNQFLSTIPAIVLATSINNPQHYSGEQGLIENAFQGQLSTSLQRLPRNLSDPKTYTPALVATGIVGGFKMLKRWLK